VASTTGVATTVIAPDTLAALASAKAKDAVVEGVWAACPAAPGVAVGGATSVWAVLD